MSETNNTASVSSLFPVLLTVLFIGLKLGEVGVVANWSWLWVLSPLWVFVSLGVTVGLLALFITFWSRR
jgi:hypothetical protein